MTTATIRRLLFAIIVTLSLLLSNAAFPTGPVPSGKISLLERQGQIVGDMGAGSFGVPLYLESTEERGRLRGDAYGIIEHPFNEVRGMLREPANWCDIASLHLNIKACTYRIMGNEKALTLYSGRKFYQPPEESYKLTYSFNLEKQQADYLKVALASDDGPFGTRDYRIVLEATPLDGGRSLIHLHYAYRFGLSARLAMKGYLATLGANKIGFSIVKRDRQGNSVYVNGTRGMIERNAIRYYLAIQAYLETAGLHEGERFNERLSYWYDLTERYRKQLFEMEKEEYLRFKHLEYLNQVRLQGELEQTRDALITAGRKAK
jgi:hypothetical protein